MARRRMISTTILSDLDFTSLNPWQRLLWIGLILNADDQGRLQGHPGLIRAAVFPVDDISLASIEADLAHFATLGWIIRYEVGGKAYIQIVSWWDHQTPQWAMPSKFPAPEGWHDRLRYRQDEQVITENWAKERRVSIPPDDPTDMDNPGTPPVEPVDKPDAAGDGPAENTPGNTANKPCINGDYTGDEIPIVPITEPKEKNNLTEVKKRGKVVALPPAPPPSFKPKGHKPQIAVWPLTEVYRLAYCEGFDFDPQHVNGKQVEKLIPSFMEAAKLGIEPERFSRLLHWWASKPGRKRYGTKDVEYALEDYARWVSLHSPPQWREGNGSHPATGARAGPSRRSIDPRRHYGDDGKKSVIDPHEWDFLEKPGEEQGGKA